MHETRILEIYEALTRHQHTLSFAESCTGGVLCAWTSAQPGISSVFRGGVIAYHADLKRDILKVPAEVLQEFGVVSIQTAAAMAHGVKKIAGSDWALSTTGIAGPSGGDVNNPVGTVCFFMVGPQIERGAREVFSGDRKTVQTCASEWALDWLMKTVTGQI